MVMTPAPTTSRVVPPLSTGAGAREEPASPLPGSAGSATPHPGQGNNAAKPLHVCLNDEPGRYVCLRSNASVNGGEAGAVRSAKGSNVGDNGTSANGSGSAARAPPPFWWLAATPGRGVHVAAFPEPAPDEDDRDIAAVAMAPTGGGGVERMDMGSATAPNKAMNAGFKDFAGGWANLLEGGCVWRAEVVPGVLERALEAETGARRQDADGSSFTRTKGSVADRDKRRTVVSAPEQFSSTLASPYKNLSASGRVHKLTRLDG